MGMVTGKEKTTMSTTGRSISSTGTSEQQKQQDTFVNDISQANISIDPIRSVHTSDNNHHKKKALIRSLFRLENRKRTTSKMPPRRLSKLFPKRNKKKKKTAKSEDVRSTKSFRVKADLQLQPAAGATTTPGEQLLKCGACGMDSEFVSDGMLVCDCNKVSYCSSDCQVWHWDNHKGSCRCRRKMDKKITKLQGGSGPTAAEDHDDDDEDSIDPFADLDQETAPSGGGGVMAAIAASKAATTRTATTTTTTATPSTSDCSSDSDSFSRRIQQQQQQQQTSSSSISKNKQQKYYRGGGYCSHVHRSYEERWSSQHVEMVIRSWKMTERQRGKLMTFKERVKDVDHFLLNDPQQLVYFLLDERGNVDEAEKWFRKVTQDRTNSIFDHDTLCETYILPDDYDYFPMCILDGYDLDGDPIHITRTGAADCWGLFQRHGRENMIRHALYYQELDVRGAWMDGYETKFNKKVTRYTVIFDLQGLSMRHIKAGLLPVLNFVSRLVQDTYPELVKHVLIIRAPSVFKLIWGLVKHFFDQELRDLMIFATSDEDSKHVMEKFIDKDVLPHVIHNEGKDGRVAKGYEHIIMEGGLLPEEGTYQTPQYAKEGRTRAEEEERKQQQAAAAAAATQQQQRQRGIHELQQSFSHSGMSETVQTSNVRTNDIFRSSSEVVVPCHCKNLLSGSYSPNPEYDDDDGVNYNKIFVHLTSGR